MVEEGSNHDTAVSVNHDAHDSVADVNHDTGVRATMTPVSANHDAGVIQNEQERTLNEQRESEAAASRPPYSAVRNSWNEFAEENQLPTIEILNKSRKAGIRKRYELIWPRIDEVYRRIRQSSFLMGDTDRGCRADFDWLWTTDLAFDKLMGGKFDDRKSRRNLVRIDMTER